MKKWTITGFIMLGLAACQTPQQEEPTTTIEYIKRPKININTEIPVFDCDFLASEIENYFNYFVSDSVLHQSDLVQNYYTLNDFQPHWIDISDTSQSMEYLSILASADLHGLHRNTYHHDRLATNLENLSFFYFETGEINYQLWAESEILLADGLILLGKHLKYGVFNPLNNEDYFYFIPSNNLNFEPFEIFYIDSLSYFFETIISSTHYK
ncbi:MAG: hypothetical protein LBP96_06055, partial [Bacteroidales bacterium]|nr:hypothetical protein [Bacteroidales bacterium]